MKKTIKVIILSAIYSLFLILTSQTKILASTADFVVNTDTLITYSTGNDYVTVDITYTRTVNNRNYYFAAEKEKTFHIPDMRNNNETEVVAERKYKMESLTVKDNHGDSVEYTIQELEIGDGIYVVIPNYKETTSSSPYEVVISYNTHDNLNKVGNLISIYGTSLPSDTVFSKESDNTISQYNYAYSIVVDKNIPALAKSSTQFTTEEINNRTYYKFSQEDRLKQAPILEFGTEAIYRFEMIYKTTKTDYIVPQVYSDIIQAASTNVYKISLPREYSETSQKVYFDSISPTPTSIRKDDEGNIIATIEVPANEDSQIVVSGYITSSQNTYSPEENSYYSISLNNYFSAIAEENYLSKYLTSTTYWESDNDYIKTIAKTLLQDQDTILGVIKTDYAYVNKILDYDESKATYNNERIGAVAALQGGGSVCMEYADSMIAILRAQGIPARAALGYANITNDKDVQTRHEWVQVWIPDYGWLSIDPTYESSNQKIGQLIDRVLWETFNGDELSNITIYSADRITSLNDNNFSVIVYAKEGTLQTSDFMVYENLVASNTVLDETSSDTSSLSMFFKTTAIGKTLLIISPILLSFLVIFLVIFIIRFIIKKNKEKKLDTSINTEQEEQQNNVPKQGYPY